MYILEVKVYKEWETYEFPTIEKVLDYVYMVEGETYLPEYRNEFQRNAPSRADIKALRLTKSFFMWRVGTDLGAIKYYLSYSSTSKLSFHSHIQYRFPKLSKFWGTVYGVDSGAERARVEKARAINSDDIYMGVN